MGAEEPQALSHTRTRPRVSRCILGATSALVLVGAVYIMLPVMLVPAFPFHNVKSRREEEREKDTHTHAHAQKSERENKTETEKQKDRA